MFNLQGRNIVISGGIRGIGLGMARGLATAGAQLSVWGRGAPTEEALRLQDLTETQYLQCEISDETSVDAAFSEAVNRFGTIHGCIANAGTGGSGIPTAQMDTKSWRNVLATNLDGSFYTLRAAAHHMTNAQVPHGRLVAVSSLSAIIGAPGYADYAASKAALGALIRTLAVELGEHGITANAIAPGWIETDMNARIIADKRSYEAIRRIRVPLKRWGQPADLAGIAVYLMSTASSYHSGDTLTIDGGYHVF